MLKRWILCLFLQLAHFSLGYDMKHMISIRWFANPDHDVVTFVIVFGARMNVFFI
jgi:hypothetical protein